MSPNAEAYRALLLDHAAGASSPARQLLVETHLRLRPSARDLADALDVAGGALLERLEPEPVAARLHGAESARAPSGAPVDALRDARALVEAALHSPGHLNWRWRAPAMREVRLPAPGATLLRLAGGRAAPKHGHAGEEVTLVLRGAYADETGRYAPGDIAFADAELDHSPYVPDGEECVCLVVTDGALRFHSLLARVANRWLA